MKNKNILSMPYVIVKSDNGERSYDLPSRMLEDRIISISGPINRESMEIARMELLYLNSINNEEPIYVYIDSEGGDVIRGLAGFISVMNFVKAPVYTIATGMAASMGAAILSAGEKGHRYAVAGSQILVHPMSGGSEGRTNDSIVDINHAKRLQNYLMTIIGYNCGQISKESFEEITDAIEMMDDDRTEYPDFKISKKAQKELDKFKNENNYDHWMFPKKALEFGIIDKILTKEDEF